MIHCTGGGDILVTLSGFGPAPQYKESSGFPIHSRGLWSAKIGGGHAWGGPENKRTADKGRVEAKLGLLYNIRETNQGVKIGGLPSESPISRFDGGGTCRNRKGVFSICRTASGAPPPERCYPWLTLPRAVLGAGSSSRPGPGLHRTMVINMQHSVPVSSGGGLPSAPVTLRRPEISASPCLRPLRFSAGPFSFPGDC